MRTALKLGSVVQHKDSKEYATIEYSSFGYSIYSFINEPSYGLILCKTTALSEEEILGKYDFIDGIPDGYVIGEYGGLMKMKN